MQQASFLRRCPWCGAEFIPGVWNQRFCTRRCNHRSKKILEGNRRRGGALPSSAPCAVCGTAFKPYSVVSRYCSLTCKGRARDLAHRYRRASRRRRIYERDGYVCQLCGVEVDPAIPYPDPWAATLDHVIPMSAGGGGEDSNLQLAHMVCNAKKGGAPRWRRPDLGSIEEQPCTM